MSTLNVMKGFDADRPRKMIHVPTKEYHNEGRTINLALSKDFSVLTIIIEGRQDTKIMLSKNTAKEFTSILGEGMV